MARCHLTLSISVTRGSGRYAPFHWDVSNGTPPELSTYVSCVRTCTRDKPKIIPMAEQGARYQMAVHVEGNGGWADRLRHLLLSGMVVLKQDMGVHEWWEQSLLPWVHYVPASTKVSEARLRHHEPTGRHHAPWRVSACVQEAVAPTTLCCELRCLRHCTTCPKRCGGSATTVGRRERLRQLLPGTPSACYRRRCAVALKAARAPRYLKSFGPHSQAIEAYATALFRGYARLYRAPQPQARSCPRGFHPARAAPRLCAR